MLLNILARSRKRLRAVAVATCFAFSLVAAAQEPADHGKGDAVDAATVKAMLDRIQQLEIEVRELRAAQSSKASVTNAVEPQPAGPTEPAPVIAHADLPQPNAFGLKMRGFANLDYRASDLSGNTNSFGLGQLDLLITSKLSDKFNVLGELSLKASDQNNEVQVDYERLLLQYNLNDYLQLNVGRYHTSIGYYNTAFHTGAWMQTAVNRPFLFAFENDGGILPVHSVGISANGLIPSGKLGLHYVAELANGRSSAPGQSLIQNSRDDNNGKAFNVGLYARPDWFRGLQVGFSAYHDNKTPPTGPNINETIYSTHIVYHTSRAEFLNEGVIVRHDMGDKFNLTSFYSQVSHQWRQYRPYFRYQYANFPKTDPMFAGRTNGPSVGLRYDFNDYAAFKAQFDHSTRRGLPSINAVTLQTAFTF